MNRLENGALAVGAPGSIARLRAEDEDGKKWLKLADSLTPDEARRFAAKINKEDSKLRALGGNGNNARVEVRLDREYGSFGAPRRFYAVWVVRTYEL